MKYSINTYYINKEKEEYFDTEISVFAVEVPAKLHNTKEVKEAKEKGLKSKNWVKTSFAPGSKVVSEYLKKSGLDKALNFQGFNVVGYGCTTCIGNSGPLDPNISTKISENNLTVCSILSGNRNFEGRVHPEVKANFLASPPLVIIYALTGNINIDITTEAIGKDKDNKNVYLKDLWPSNNEIQEIINKTLKKEIFIDKYKNIDNENVLSDSSINANSISEISGIPRPTCIRKLEKLLKLGLLVREVKTKRYYVNHLTSDRPKHITKKENIVFTIQAFSNFLSILISTLIRNEK